MLDLAIGFDLALQLDEFLGACIHATENPTMIKGYRSAEWSGWNHWLDEREQVTA